MELRWARRARKDLFDIADHYEEIDPNLSDRILDKVETTPLFLIEHPFAGSPVPDTPLRTWPIRGTPYLLLYRVSRAAVEVVRVVHHSTNWHGDL
jgi:toxin ParE1/3/4